MRDNHCDLLARELEARCRGKLKRDEPLGKHTTFGVGGAADLFFAPADLEDLARAVPLLKDAAVPIFPLGGGTNTLVRDSGFRGLVVSLTAGARQLKMGGDEVVAQAGASTQVVARQCQRAGKSGLEFGCGIPGSIGGAIWGNAGAWGGETLDALTRLRGVDLGTGRDLCLAQADISFGYRYADLPEDLLIVEAGFRVTQGDPQVIAEAMDRMLAERKAAQPLANRSCGCIFKNPPGHSAGALIDRAGCKGMAVRAVSVSEVHANFMVNLGGHSADDVLALIERVRARVFEVHKVELETEVQIVGEP